MPTEAAPTITARNAGRQNTSEARTIRPRLVPTAMAAGRLRPARPLVVPPARRLPGPRCPAVKANSASEVDVAAVGAFHSGPTGGYVRSSSSSVPLPTPSSGSAAGTQ
jgi:hypothetical protein